MTKYPFYRPFGLAFAVGVLFLLTLPLQSDARIGERRTSLESRIVSSGGIIYRDDSIEQSRRRGMPYEKYLELLPGAEVRIYFKTADGRNPSSSELDEKKRPDGWDLHVVYVDGMSAIEIYKRSGAMSEFEFIALMGVQAEGDSWKRLEKKDKEELVSAFAIDMVRRDGSVRAKKMGGDALLLVSPQIDELLAKMNTEKLQEDAPLSVQGF